MDNDGPFYVHIVYISDSGAPSGDDMLHTFDKSSNCCRSVKHKYMCAIKVRLVALHGEKDKYM